MPGDLFNGLVLNEVEASDEVDAAAGEARKYSGADIVGSGGSALDKIKEAAFRSSALRLAQQKSAVARQVRRISSGLTKEDPTQLPAIKNDDVAKARAQMILDNTKKESGDGEPAKTEATKS